MILPTALLCLQVAMLCALVWAARASARHALERAFNPAALMAFFYFLWMLLPQVFALSPTHDVIGMEDVPVSLRQASTLRAQGLLLLFLSALAAGYLVALGLPGGTIGARTHAPPLDPPCWIYGGTTYAVGIAAFFLLGRHLQSMPEGTMRSALVKDSGGLVLMTLSFFGSFGVAYLTAHLWLRRERVLPLLLFGAYAWLVLPLGARGRILWPAVTALLFIWGRAERLRLGRIVVLGVLAMAALVLIDPLVYGLRHDDYARLAQALSPTAMFELLFHTRNFDGFGNLLFITHHDRIAPDAGRLLTGSRDVYMNTYYPDIYAMGVAFPTTIPGEFWLAGGTPLLGAMSMVYGLGLGLLQRFVRHARHESRVWIYLLLAPWVTAVGGELAESMQKMVAAAAPALVWWLATRAWPTQLMMSGPALQRP